MNTENVYNQLVTHANDAWDAYDRGQPSISDPEWDDMVAKIESIESESGYVSDDSPTRRVGNFFNLPTVKHNHPVVGIKKSYSIDDIKKFIVSMEEKVGHPIDWVIEPKIDGMACSLQYDRCGNLVSAATKGRTFREGSDITDRLEKNFFLKKLLAGGPPGAQLVGELYMHRSAYLRLANRYVDARSAVVAIIQSSNDDLISDTYISFKPHSFPGWSLGTYEEAQRVVEDIGGSLDTVIMQHDCVSSFLALQSAEAYRSNLPMDGQVIKPNDLQLCNRLGDDGRHYNWCIAYKFRRPNSSFQI